MPKTSENLVPQKNSKNDSNNPEYFDEKNNNNLIGEININNVQNIEIDWIFNSGEPQSIQCNPIIVEGVIYTPIGGNYIAAIDGSNGKLLWKSKKFKSTLAKRGIIYWKDSKSKIERIFFKRI